MATNIEQLSIKRRKMLIGFTTGFTFFFFALIFNHFALQWNLPKIYEILFTLFGLLSWGIGSFHLIRMLGYRKHLKKSPELNAALNGQRLCPVAPFQTDRFQKRGY